MPATVAHWIHRAEERTARFLREDVDTAQMLARLAGTTDPLPPTEATMKKVAQIEARVVSGEAFRSEGVSQMSALLAELPGVTETRNPASAPHGRVTLRFQVTAGLARYYRWLETPTTDFAV